MSLASLRQAVRALRIRPSLTLAAITTIGLSVGTATAIYSAVQAVLLTPLPFAHPDRLVMVWETDLKKGAAVVELSHREFEAFRDRARVFDALAAVTAANLRVNLTGRGDAVQVEAALISPGYFRALGVAPQRGRDFGDSERTDTTGARVLISDGLWRRQYGADEALVGRDISVGGSPSTIVGVMPPGMLPRNVDVWISTAGLAEGAPDLGVLKLIGRMKTRVTLEAARANLDVVTAALAREQPARGSLGAQVVPLADQIYGQTRPALRLLVASVACLLLIACANVANLLLARGVDRERELAVRAAMGASGRRLAAQLFGESLMLGLLGGGAGVLIATWAVSIVSGLIPVDVPGVDRLAIDWRVLGVALTLSLGAAVLFGTAPAWRASRVDAGDVVRESSLRVAGSRRVGRARGVLVAGQLALSLGLVAGAALAAQSFATLARLEPGFDAAGVITAKIQLSDRYPDHKSRAAFYGPLLDRLSALPGVDSAGLVLLRPLADPIGWDYPFSVEGQTPEAQARNPHANYESISPNYFSTMKIPLIDGRIFNNADGPDAGPVAIVSASMARRFWPGESAIGKRLKAGPPDSKQAWKTVVGVVGDVRYREWTAVRADFYVPYTQWNFGRMDLVVRASGPDPLGAVAAIRAAVRDADPEIALATVSTMSNAVEEATAGPRFTAVLLVALACIALVVAAVGTFSVLAWSVERRTREFGVRIALGANRAHVLRLVLGQAVVLTGIGIVAGLGVALAGSRGLGELLYEISPTDPLTLAGAVALLSAVGIGGGLVASRRALSVDPAIALREE
jgi:putative ABC transport system permease protein